MGKDHPDEKLSSREIAQREADVLNHFLKSAPVKHKPLGKNPQARRKKEKRAK